VELRGELTNLPPALEAALYRVTQESVTNAQRHAQQATRVKVTVTGNATDVQLSVSDDGARTTPTRLLAGPDIADPIAVVVITTLDTDEYVYGALKAGARGFLLKGAEPDQLVQAIHAAVQGDALIDPGVTGRLLAASRPTPPPLRWSNPLRPSQNVRKKCSARSREEGRTPRSPKNFTSA
jgi:DNA-binding NarL/FixJ family response regulator